MISNQETKFSEIPNLEKPRSRFDRSFDHKTSINTGELIPIMVSECYPGDTITSDFSHVTRMTTPITPVMDNCYMDVYAFFVPNRLVWDNWQMFWGENDSPWKQTVQKTIPQLTSPSGGWDSGSLADYMGIPPYVDNLSVNALPFRAYCKIWSDWFRDENLKNAKYFPTGDATVTGVKRYNGSPDEVNDPYRGGKPAMVAKPHDYFTSALPEPQKGPDVSVPLGASAPVFTGPDQIYKDNSPLRWRYSINGTSAVTQGSIGLDSSGDTSHGNDTFTPYYGALQPSNLYADLSLATASTINQLRQAYAVQRFYEAQARGGSRYIEFIQNIFGVTSPDARQQRSEFCGGKRFPINMDQCLQTSSTDTTSPQGNTAAWSCTVNADNLATYTATEHGFFMVLCCIRTTHSYQQGIEKFWSRKLWTDFYVPQFAHLGEQAIYEKEIYAQGNSTDDTVFGYQEAWADLRYQPNRISGQLRSTSKDSGGSPNSLDIWHYGDYYTSTPLLSGTWIDETQSNIQRTLAVQSESQFICDFYFKNIWTRILPLYSVPGLGDHY